MAMSTRGGGKTVVPTRTSSRRAPDEAATSPVDAARSAASILGGHSWSKLLLDPAHDSVQLKATELSHPLPTISEVEAVFVEWCRHRVWRIEVRDSKAIVDVHPDDASSCIAGVTHINDKKVDVIIVDPPSVGSDASGQSKKRQRSPMASSNNNS